LPSFYDGYSDDKSGTDSHCRRNGKGSPMFFGDDIMADCQSLPGSFANLFSGKKGSNIFGLIGGAILFPVS